MLYIEVKIAPKLDFDNIIVFVKSENRKMSYLKCFMCFMSFHILLLNICESD